MIDADVAAAMSLDDHRRAFAAGIAAVLAEFNTYLDGTAPIRSATGRAFSG